MSDPDHHAEMEEHYALGLRIQDLELEIERLQGLLAYGTDTDAYRKLAASRDEWKQAAGVEASLRREFLTRAEKTEAEIERLRTERDEWKANYEAAYHALSATIKEFNP